jgi:hypothetical protein
LLSAKYNFKTIKTNTLSKKRAPHQPGELAAQSRPEPLIAMASSAQAVHKHRRCEILKSS